jgi:hypothetical protein
MKACISAGKLFAFPVKPRNLPAKAAYFLHGLRVVLFEVMGHDIFGALCGKHNWEEVHLMTARKTFPRNQFTLLFFRCWLIERVPQLMEKVPA